MRLAAPTRVTQVLAQFAVQKAREDVQGRGWKSGGALMPYSAPGEVGISTTMKHLLYQNAGVKSFIMYWVNGRTVPIKGPGGAPHFVRGREAGLPGYVTIPGRGRVWRDQKWCYPGLKPKRFIETAISGAIKENKALIKAEIMAIVSGKPSAKDGAQWLD
jgi:hypothetical protein